MDKELRKKLNRLLEKHDYAAIHPADNLQEISFRFMSAVLDEFIMKAKEDKTEEQTIEEMSASEALYGFVGWLTTQDEPITAGSTHDCAVWAEKIKEFCDVNKLSEPREDWTTRLIHPDGEVSK